MDGLNSIVGHEAQGVGGRKRKTIPQTPPTAPKEADGENRELPARLKHH